MSRRGNNNMIIGLRVTSVPSDFGMFASFFFLSFAVVCLLAMSKRF